MNDLLQDSPSLPDRTGQVSGQLHGNGTLLREAALWLVSCGACENTPKPRARSKGLAREGNREQTTWHTWVIPAGLCMELGQSHSWLILFPLNTIFIFMYCTLNRYKVYITLLSTLVMTMSRAGGHLHGCIIEVTWGMGPLADFVWSIQPQWWTWMK